MRHEDTGKSSRQETEKLFPATNLTEQLRPSLVSALTSKPFDEDGLYVFPRVGGQQVKVGSYYVYADRFSNGNTEEEHRRAITEGWGTINASFPTDKDSQVTSYEYTFCVPDQLGRGSLLLLAAVFQIPFRELYLKLGEEAAKGNDITTSEQMQAVLGNTERDLKEPIVIATTFTSDHANTKHEILSERTNDNDQHFQRLHELYKELKKT